MLKRTSSCAYQSCLHNSDDTNSMQPHHLLNASGMCAGGQGASRVPAHWTHQRRRTTRCPRRPQRPPAAGAASRRCARRSRAAPPGSCPPPRPRAPAAGSAPACAACPAARRQTLGSRAARARRGLAPTLHAAALLRLQVEAHSAWLGTCKRPRPCHAGCLRLPMKPYAGEEAAPACRSTKHPGPSGCSSRRSPRQAATSTVDACSPLAPSPASLPDRPLVLGGAPCSASPPPLPPGLLSAAPSAQAQALARG